MVRMPMIPTDGRPLKGEAVPERSPPDAAIRAGIITALGHPPGLFRVAVLKLWENHYRVNVMTGLDPTSVRISHSYFVRTGDAGELVSTIPRITRLY
jgi:hypothetical protein